MFRMAGIVQGVYKRALDGNASSEKAKGYGKMVPVLAESGPGREGGTSRSPEIATFDGWSYRPRVAHLDQKLENLLIY